ncbi:MarC family protein [Synechococcus sp. PCC 7502]|uniref:MarC family protein n=1 Tax=Synechococcus sp. PCC 7502 TaxID=1173263 RepID=UPI0002F98C1A|nr:MarC family protein [Synechococcus sp. PCC 7502]
MWQHITQDAITLFVIIDPIALVPVFISITHREEPEARQKIALRAVLLSAGILGGFLIFGQFLLAALGVSLPAFQIGGGLVLLIVGLQMVLEEANDTKEEITSLGDVAVFPLAIPFIAGPGAIMSVVLLTDNNKFSIPDQAITGGVIIIILAFTYWILMQSEGIQNLLGNTGANMITRIIGLIVVAIAVQTMLTGVSNFFQLSQG